MAVGTYGNAHFMAEQTVEEVVQILITDLTAPYKGNNRRDAERFVVLVPAKAFLLDDDFNKQSEGFEVIVRDISESGVSVLSQVSVESQYVLLQFGQMYRDASIVFAVLRGTAVKADYLGGFHQVSGEFVESGLEGVSST